jgi:hypothetical protein
MVEHMFADAEEALPRESWMHSLDSAIGVLRTEDVFELRDEELEAEFVQLHRRLEQLDVERLRRLAAIDRRALHERDGHLSTVSWLVHALKLAWGRAHELVRVARGLDEMPRTRDALESGDVSTSAVGTLVAAREVDPLAFARSEEQLLEAARLHSVRDLGRVAAAWRERVAEDDPSGKDRALRAGRRLHTSVSFSGMVRINGDLDPETGETVLTALGAVMDAESRSGAADERTANQRRADALGEICRRSLDRVDHGRVAGERPHVTVTVNAADLAGEGREGRGTGTSELDHVGPVGSHVARRLACDASVMRVVMAGPSEPLDVGRRTSVVSPGLRRAVIARDRTCRFPGCDRPHAWCEAHHVVHWADGGSTALSNLVLLCRRHHGILHERGGFSVQMLDGRPVFRRPDGSVLEEDRAPPG